MRYKLPESDQRKIMPNYRIDNLCRNEFAFQRFVKNIPTKEIDTSNCVRRMNHDGSCLVQNPNNKEWYWIHGAEREPGKDLVMNREKGLYIPIKGE